MHTIILYYIIAYLICTCHAGSRWMLSRYELMIIPDFENHVYHGEVHVYWYKLPNLVDQSSGTLLKDVKLDEHGLRITGFLYEVDGTGRHEVPIENWMTGNGLHPGLTDTQVNYSNKEIKLIVTFDGIMDSKSAFYMTGKNLAMTRLWPSGCSSLYPCVNSTASLAHYRLIVLAPSNFSVISAGELEENDSNRFDIPMLGELAPNVAAYELMNSFTYARKIYTEGRFTSTQHRFFEFKSTNRTSALAFGWAITDTSWIEYIPDESRWRPSVQRQSPFPEQPLQSRTTSVVPSLRPLTPNSRARSWGMLRQSMRSNSFPKLSNSSTQIQRDGKESPTDQLKTGHSSRMVSTQGQFHLPSSQSHRLLSLSSGEISFSSLGGSEDLEMGNIKQIDKSDDSMHSSDELIDTRIAARTSPELQRRSTTANPNPPICFQRILIYAPTSDSSEMDSDDSVENVTNENVHYIASIAQQALEKFAVNFANCIIPETLILIAMDRAPDKRIPGVVCAGWASIASIHHDKLALETMKRTRARLEYEVAFAVAQQLMYANLSLKSFDDLWLMRAIPAYMAFGFNDLWNLLDEEYLPRAMAMEERLGDGSLPLQLKVFDPVEDLKSVQRIVMEFKGAAVLRSLDRIYKPERNESWLPGALDHLTSHALRLLSLDSLLDFFQSSPTCAGMLQALAHYPGTPVITLSAQMVSMVSVDSRSVSPSILSSLFGFGSSSALDHNVQSHSSTTSSSNFQQTGGNDRSQHQDMSSHDANAIGGSTEFYPLKKVAERNGYVASKSSDRSVIRACDFQLNVSHLSTVGVYSVGSIDRVCNLLRGIQLTPAPGESANDVLQQGGANVISEMAKKLLLVIKERTKRLLGYWKSPPRAISFSVQRHPYGFLSTSSQSEEGFLRTPFVQYLTESELELVKEAVRDVFREGGLAPPADLASYLRDSPHLETFVIRLCNRLKEISREFQSQSSSREDRSSRSSRDGDLRMMLGLYYWLGTGSSDTQIYRYLKHFVNDEMVPSLVLPTSVHLERFEEYDNDRLPSSGVPSLYDLELETAIRRAADSMQTLSQLIEFVKGIYGRVDLRLSDSDSIEWFHHLAKKLEQCKQSSGNTSQTAELTSSTSSQPSKERRYCDPNTLFRLFGDELFLYQRGMRSLTSLLRRMLPIIQLGNDPNRSSGNPEMPRSDANLQRVIQEILLVLYSEMGGSHSHSKLQLKQWISDNMVTPNWSQIVKVISSEPPTEAEVAEHNPRIIEEMKRVHRTIPVIQLAVAIGHEPTTELLLDCFRKLTDELKGCRGFLVSMLCNYRQFEQAVMKRHHPYIIQAMYHVAANMGEDENYDTVFKLYQVSLAYQILVQHRFNMNEHRFCILASLAETDDAERKDKIARLVVNSKRHFYSQAFTIFLELVQPDVIAANLNAIVIQFVFVVIFVLLPQFRRHTFVSEESSHNSAQSALMAFIIFGGNVISTLVCLVAVLLIADFGVSIGKRLKQSLRGCMKPHLMRELLRIRRQEGLANLFDNHDIFIGDFPNSGITLIERMDTGADSEEESTDAVDVSSRYLPSVHSNSPLHQHDEVEEIDANQEAPTTATSRFARLRRLLRLSEPTPQQSTVNLGREIDDLDL